MKVFLTVICIALMTTTASAAVVDLIGDDDCFGSGATCTEGTRAINPGDVTADSADPVNFDVLTTGATFSWTHSFAAGQYTDAMITFRTVGLADVSGPYDFFADGQAIAVITFDPPSNFDVQTYSFDVASSFLIDGSVTFSYSTSAGDGSALDFAELSGTFVPTAAVPLPAALPLLLVGLGSMGALRRRKKQTAN